jgi:hypothetical protein
VTRSPPRLVGQVRGMLLEEAILVLLRQAGYRTVEYDGLDPTLGTCAAGLQVRGRGGEHQIDAVADYLVMQPFSNPQRLLVEAKCFSSADVDLQVVRNALGVFRDVCEYWRAPRSPSSLASQRYHYHYAVFSATSFTQPAQRFAFAHDIHLLPLGRSTFFRPVIEGVERSARLLTRLLHPQSADVTLSSSRKQVRDALRGWGEAGHPILRACAALLAACQQVGAAYLAMVGGGVPLLLVPDRALRPQDLPPELLVRIRRRMGGWYVQDSESSRRLFSFDLPEEIFRLYAEEESLSRAGAAQLKSDILQEIQLTSVVDGRPRLHTLRLDMEWMAQVQEQAGLRQTDNDV